MNKTQIVRKTHRWMSLLIGIQMLLWILGGLYFSLIPIETIRGEHLKTESKPDFRDLPDNGWSADHAVRAVLANRSDIDRVAQIQVIKRQGQAYYQIDIERQDITERALVRMSDGHIEPPVTESLARELALASLKEPGVIRRVERLTEVSSDSEYRNKPLPAWRIDLSSPSIATLYVSEQTGKVTSIRTDAWRFFDFLWMLHTLDFESRDNFNHWFLSLMSVFALITVISGYLLWMITTRRFG